MNDYTTGDQSRPRVAMDADGDFVVTWQSNGQDGSGDGVYARRYKFGSGAQGPSFRVNTVTSGAQNYPSVGMSAGGDFVVAWESDGQDGSGYGVYAQRYAAAGTTQGTEFRVNSYANANQAVPVVAMDRSGDFTIAWQSYGQDGSGYGMYAQRYSPSGVPQGTEFRVNTYTAADQWYGVMGMDAEGDFVVAWTSKAGQDGSADGVYADRFTSISPRTAGPLIAGVNVGWAREKVLAGNVLTRSDLNQLVVTFSENLTSSVTSLANWALTRDGQPVVGAITGVSFSLNTETNSYEAVLTLNASLAKGVYVLQAQPTILDTDGNALDGDYNGVAGGVFSFNFSVDPITVGPEFRVSADPTAQVTDPGVRPNGNGIAQDAQGNFVVVWAADGVDGSGYGVRARRYTASGLPLGPEFTVNTYTLNDQGAGSIEVGDSGPPKVAMNASGAFVITWTSLDQDGSGHGIYAQRFDSAGNRVGGEFRANGTTAGYQVAPAVDINDAGQFVITWQSPDSSGGYDIYARSYHADGTRVGNEFRVNVNQTNWQNVPSVAMRADGGFVIVWNSYLQDGSSNGIYLRRYDDAGIPQTGDVRVNTTTAGDQSSFHRQTIDMDAVGNFVVVWNSDGQDGSGYAVYAQRYNATGQRQGGEFRVNTQTFDDQSSASAAMAPNGDFLITWLSAHQDGSGGGIYAQRYNAAGVPQGGEFRVNASTIRNQDTPAAVMGSDGNFVVAWMSRHDAGQGLPRGVFAQRFSIPGAAPDILVTPTSGLFTSEIGGAASFTVRLNTQPTANVTIGLSSSHSGEGSPSVSSLTFTPTNWNIGQTVLITGSDDAIDDGDVSYAIVTAPAVSIDPNYNGRNALDVAVVNINDDTAGITVTPTSGLVTAEAGGTATFSVRLDTQPTSTVTIGLTSSNTNEGSLSVGSLVFTTLNWNIAQTVTVTGVDDAIHDGNISYTIITAPAVALDPKYDSRNAPDLAVTNVDNDSPGITVSPTTGLVTTEAGGSATFTVRLNTQPTATVTIPVSSNNVAEGTVSTSSVTFTSINWNIPQFVTVTGVNDAIDDGDVAYTIVLGAAVSADPGYSGQNPADVAVVNSDDDTADIIVTPMAGLVTTEAGGTATFLVRLGSQPTANVSINLSASNLNEGTINTNSLTFTPANWNTSQVVTLTGVDDDVEDGSITYNIVTAPAVSVDPKYGALNGPDVAAVNLDDDSVGIKITSTSGLVTNEAGATATFTVSLNSRPTATVTIGFSSSNLGEGVVSVGSLTFTPANWNVLQTVTVTGVNDAFDDGDVGYGLQIAPAVSADPGYDDLISQNVDLVNLDDDTRGFTVTPTSGLVTTEAGGVASFTVRLNSQPTSVVTVGLSSSNPNEGSLSVSGLSFTPANWNVPQTVSVTGMNDSVDDGDVAYSIVTTSAVSADPTYNDLDAWDVALTNLDDDTAGISLTPTNGLVTSEAAGTASFSVRLNSKPIADVTVGLHSDNPGEGTIRFSSLTFTPANWNIPQVVNITGVDDGVDDGDVTYRIVTNSAVSGDPRYNGVDPSNVVVKNVDNDTAGITLTPTSGLVTTEGGGSTTFSVRLNSQPTGNVTIAIASTNVGEGVVNTGSLTFTPVNWHVAQMVTVTGVDDVAVDGTVGYTIVTAPASSNDPRYNGVKGANVGVMNIDNDVAPLVTISSARIVQQKVRRKIAMTVAVTFNGDVDGATARTLANYSITAAGRDRKFGTRDDVVTRLTAVTYDPGTRTAILTPRNSTLALKPRPQFRVRSGGLLDSLRRPIDGNRDGSPGGDWVSIL
ncbi:hypothetical protein V5E97_23895 [Singulisphaera sp. Ch08]|uniref:Uncharacterized protein n=1 Tax=Singulisphaera sp. Ch08 TaxID=3120278 RepID=A0AAU7C8C6_9BACT